MLSPHSHSQEPPKDVEQEHEQQQQKPQRSDAPRRSNSTLRKSMLLKDGAPLLLLSSAELDAHSGSGSVSKKRLSASYADVMFDIFNRVNQQQSEDDDDNE